jgi:N-acetylated-alpha-linked acidic dipeptidase
MNKVLTAFVMVFAFQASFAQTKITGFSNENSAKQMSLESSFDKNLKAENIGENIRILSAEPHHLSSAKGKENAQYI